MVSVWLITKKLVGLIWIFLGIICFSKVVFCKPEYLGKMCYWVQNLSHFEWQMTEGEQLEVWTKSILFWKCQKTCGFLNFLRGRVLSTHAAGRGEGVLKLRANACKGGGGVQPMSTHLNPYVHFLRGPIQRFQIFWLISYGAGFLLLLSTKII